MGKVPSPDVEGGVSKTQSPMRRQGDDYDGGKCEKNTPSLSSATPSSTTPFLRSTSPLRPPKHPHVAGAPDEGSPFAVSSKLDRTLYALHHGNILPRGSAGAVLLVVVLSLCPVTFYWGTQCRTAVMLPQDFSCSCPGGAGAGQNKSDILLSQASEIDSLPLQAALQSTTSSDVQPQSQPPVEDAANGTGIAEEGTRKEPLGLEEVLERVGGKDKTIIFATASKDYLDLMENWVLSVQRVGYGDKVMLVAEDEEALSVLLKKWPNKTVSGQQLWEGVSDVVKDKIEKQGRSHNSDYYNSLVDRRPEYFKTLIELGVSFLYNDVDVVWLRDPFPFFRGNFDMWVQEDSFTFGGAMGRFQDGLPKSPIPNWLHNMCTCFMFVKPTMGSKRLVEAWSQNLKDEAKRHKSHVLNQPSFNKMYNETKPGDVAVGVLPIGNFPSGCLYFRREEYEACREHHNEFWKAVDQKRTFPVAVHNNWVRGKEKKIRSFEAWNLWLLPSPFPVPGQP